MNGKRYKLVFQRGEDLRAALAAETVGGPVRYPVYSEERRFVAVGVDERVAAAVAPETEPELLLRERAEELAERYGARLVEDVQYEPDRSPPFGAESFRAAEEAGATLDDVLERIRAPEAWEHTRGEGVAIAIVDTGVNGQRPEFPDGKRVGAWAPRGESAWEDVDGHGTMCACIAAATRSAGGEFDGVAPGAGLISCRTAFYDSELTVIYDYLAGLAEQGKLIVASNSFGIRSGSPPSAPPGETFPDALQDAVRVGVHVFFSAGNNHGLAGGDPADCHPTSIWRYKCREDVAPVATCDLDGRMWYYSSRGPGQHHGDPGTNGKPDFTAPTPADGRILYGDRVVTLADGWGTSGACPQAAGLGALLRALAPPALGYRDLFDAIADAARPLGHGNPCEGAGLIDCAAGIARVAPVV